MSEVYFPRGPVNRLPINTTNFIKRKNDGDALFKFKRNTNKKKQSTNIKKSNQGKDLAWNVDSVEKIGNLFKTVPDQIINLKYTNIVEGLVLAGRIREINSSRVGISLPGRVLAHANVNKISTPYTERLQSLSNNLLQSEDVAELSELFQIGELVTVAVDTVTKNNGKFTISVSLNPSDVNKIFSNSTLAPNMVLIGAIKSIEDHGYMVDLGIKSVTGFLPKKNASQFSNGGNCQLVVGRLVRTVIKNINKSSSKTTVVLSLKEELVSSAIPGTGFSNTNILPGSQLKVSITKVLPNGLVVRPSKTSEEIIGHVALNHLPNPWCRMNSFKPGMSLPATLLYTIPHADIMHFSLKPQLHHINPKRQFHDGALVKDAKVAAITAEGVYFQLESKELGAKGLVSKSQSGDNTDFKEGDEHTLRIIHFDFVEDLYICSLKPEIISLEVFSIDDLQIGQLIEGLVDKIIPDKGISLKVGNVSVFAPLFQLSDFPQDTKNLLHTMYKPKSVVKAKVLSKSECSCFVTLKPLLLSTRPLHDYSDATIGSSFYGTVKSVFNNGIVVWFYNQITGFIPNKHISPEDTGIIKNAIQVGQTVKCYVVFVDPTTNKLILSLIPKTIDRGFDVGSKYSITVLETQPEGFKVKISNTEICGLLPFNQLSDHVMLLQPLKDHYRLGCVIDSAVLYSTDLNSAPLFSLRRSVMKFSEDYPEVTTPNLNLQKNEVIVPCTVLEILENGLNVDVCIPNSRNYFISREDIFGYTEEEFSSLSVNQAVMCVSSVTRDGFKLHLDKNKFYDISEVGFGIDTLQDYLSSSKQLQSFSAGEKAQASVSKIKKKIVEINLPAHNSKGIIHRKYCKNDLKIDNSIEVTILWQSPSTHYVGALPTTGDEIEIESIDQSKARKQVPAKVVMVEKEFAIVLISKGPLKSQIAFVPTKSHVNDFAPKQLPLRAIIQIIPVLFEKNFVIAVDEAKLVEHSQRTGQRIKKILSQLLKNADQVFDTYHSPDMKLMYLHGCSQMENGMANELDKENDGNVHKKNERKSIGSLKSLESMTNGDDLTPNKILKKKKKSSLEQSSLLNGNAEESGSFNKINSKKQGNDENAINEEVPKKKKKSTNSLLEDSEFMDDSSPAKKKKKKKSLDDSLNNTGSVNQEGSIGLDSSSSKKKKKNRKSSDELSNSNGILNQEETIGSKFIGSDANESEQEDISTVGSKKRKLSSKQNGHSDSIVGRREKKRKSLDEISNENGVESDSNKHELMEGLKSRLSSQGYEGFSWSVDAKDFSITQEDNNDSEDDNDDEIDDKSSKKGRSLMTASEKRAAAKESELRLRRAEQLLLEAESNPQSVDHFERLVLAHPNSSMLWIKYMAMHLQETEIEKARTIARRALQIINPREEEERLNVWTALLNLENLYGTEESLKSILAEAVRTNDDYQVYSKMLEIYANSDKAKHVEQLTGMMAKKFKTRLDCWLLCCRNLMRVSSLEKARSFFQRGLEALTKKDHVQFITRFALLENSLGSFDHAQTVMDHVLMTYPGRVPAWTTYVDMLTKSGRLDLARQVLQRSVGQKLPVKKMKTLYKKWLDFEQLHGTKANISHVKDMAEQYVNSLSVKIDDS